MKSNRFKMKSQVSLLLFSLVAFAAANPAAEGEWRWEIKQQVVSPNPKAIPFDKLVKESSKPKTFIPGHKVVADCGKSKYHGQERIVGGTEAVPNSWPWQVALFFSAGWFCGGSIIDTNWVLTAAHCADGGISVDIVAGAHNIRENEPTQVTYTSSDFTVHEDWGSLLVRNDIALIYVAEGIQFTPEIQPVCLPARSQADLGAGEMVTPTGWGITEDGGLFTSPTLNQVTDPTITNAECELTYGAVVTEDLVCISAEGGKGVCSGDSGGPLNYDIGGGVYCTEGVTSFVSSSGCESGLPDGFTRLNHYLDWIETNTGIIVPQ